MGVLEKYLGGVGRGVLRFWGPRYRQTRSNFDVFWDFCGISISGGVDIIYEGLVWVSLFRLKFIRVELRLGLLWSW